MKRIIFSLLAMVLLIGCSNDDSSSEQNVAFNTVFKSDFFNTEYSPNNDVTMQMFNNLESWNNFLTNFNNNISEIIDFEQYTIVAVIDKNHPDGGYDFKVTGITENGNTLKINVSSFLNGIWHSPSRPIHIVSIPKTTKDLELQMNFINN